MEQNSDSNKNGYKTLSVILIVILAIFVVGAFAYWNELNNTQKEQQAQIDSLNQQIADDKNSLSSEVQKARDEANQALTEKNAELQQKLDSLSPTPDDSGNDSTDESAQ
jgi:cell shape-determining protein MreC